MDVVSPTKYFMELYYWTTFVQMFDMMWLCNDYIYQSHIKNIHYIYNLKWNKI